MVKITARVIHPTCAPSSAPPRTARPAASPSRPARARTPFPQVPAMVRTPSVSSTLAPYWRPVTAPTVPVTALAGAGIK
jgi:hypothetical protein